ncbi:MAG: hypothetical protein O3B41_05730 [Bacteroidetes bacterium]|nr:hypothetical protein [Bacteroidota bacterium]
MTRIVLFLLTICLVGGCSSDGAKDPNVDPVSGFPIFQPVEPIVVEIFAPGVVSSTWPEFGISFTAGGDTLYFTRTIKDRTKASILRSFWKDSTWQEPEVAPFSGPTFDVDPHVTPDGGIFYSSLQYDLERDSLASFDFWFWPGSGDPVRLPRPLNSDANESFITGTADGDLYFGSNRSDSARIYITDFRDGQRYAPVVVPIEGVTNPGHPLISLDGNTMVFGSEMNDGQTQLSFVCLIDGKWSLPTLLPEPINSPDMEYAPGMDPAGFLYFSSERPGMVIDDFEGDQRPSDIYKTNLKVSSLCATK